MKVRLYTIDCPMCAQLEDILTQKKIPFERIDDIPTMEKLGITHTPVLDVDGQMMNTKESMRWALRYE